MDKNEYTEDETVETREEETDTVEDLEDEPEESDTEKESVEEPKEEDEEEAIDWKERALKAEKLIERNKRDAKEVKKAKPESSMTSNDALLARLENRGVMESEDQEYVIKFAKVEGINPIEALKDPIVQDRLERFKKIREQRQSTISPNNRTGQKESEVDRWVRRYKRDGTLPDNNPALISKILDKLKNN